MFNVDVTESGSVREAKVRDSMIPDRGMEACMVRALEAMPVPLSVMARLASSTVSPQSRELTEPKMNYPDGKKVMVGDQVKLWEGCHGTVVASMDDGEYTPQYLKADWSYLKNGVLISSDKAGLIHYIRPESSFELVQRSPGKVKA
jgi:hypothetical protein